MHVLEYLGDPKCEKKPEGSLFAEYRLLCSGTLHRDTFGDYSKSEVARILLDDPLLLFVASRPFDDYPLELALELTVPRVEEKGERGSLADWTHYYHPDGEVVRDLAALLTLLCRRLISVAGKVSEHYSDYRHVLFQSRPFPLPFTTSVRNVCWPPQPCTVLTSFVGQELQDYNPRPKPVDSSRLTEMLLALPKLQHAQSLVASCRLYALAMEMIHERPDISYPFLISSVETIANAVLRDFEPSDEAKVEHQRSVYKLALALELDEDKARQLAVEASKTEWWATKKFKRFLIDNVPESVWAEPDELFYRMPQEGLPKHEEFERTLGKIYNARSKATHEGLPFPVSASYTGGPYIDVRAANMLYCSDSPFPPVVWFERIVNSAILNFWARAVPASQ